MSPLPENTPCAVCSAPFTLARIRQPHEPASDGWGNSSTASFVRSSDATSSSEPCPPEAGCMLARREICSHSVPPEGSIFQGYLRRTSLRIIEKHEEAEAGTEEEEEAQGTATVDGQDWASDDDDDDDDYDEEEDSDWDESDESEDPYEYDTPDEDEPEPDSDEEEEEGDDEAEAEEDDDNEEVPQLVEAVKQVTLHQDTPAIDDPVPMYSQDGTPAHFPDLGDTHALEHLATSALCRHAGGYNGAVIPADEMRWTRISQPIVAVGGGNPVPVSVHIHSACLEIFNRVSASNGQEDIQVFADPSTTTMATITQAPHRAAVWKYVPGEEHLASDPFSSDAMTAFFHSLALASSADPHANVFPSWPATVATTTPSDPFTRIPSTARQLIASHLPLTSLGSLRLSSRAFLALPNSLFRGVVLSEYPWVWEALCQHDNNNKDGIPGESLVSEGEKTQMTVLSKEGTDWFKLVGALVRDDEARGLKSRERIWKACEWILEGPFVAEGEVQV